MMKYNEFLKNMPSYVGVSISLTIFVLAFWVIHKTLHTFSVDDVITHFGEHSLSVIVIATLWIGLFTFKAVPYSSDIWWIFAYDAEFSRFLRGMAEVTAVCIGVAMFNLRQPLRAT